MTLLNILKKNKFWFWSIVAALAALLALDRLEQLEARRNPPPVKPKPLAVEAVPARIGPISQWVLSEGTARFVRKRSLRFETSGKVIFLAKENDGMPIREGSRVRGPKPGRKHGQLLASLDQRDQIEGLKRAEAELAGAREQGATARADKDKAGNNLELADIQFKRVERLFQKKAVSLSELQKRRTEYLNARSEHRNAGAALKSSAARVKAAEAAVISAKTALERTSIFAPFDGVVARLNIEEGHHFQASQVDNADARALLATSPITVIDPGGVEVTLAVPYFEGNLVKPGQTAIIPLDGLDWQSASRAGEQKLLTGRVHSVSPLLDPSQRTVRVKVRFPKNRGRLFDGMHTSCLIQVKHNPRAVLIPLGSLLFENDKPYVFAARQGAAHKIPVKLGLADSGHTEVTSRLRPGELLVTKGRRLLHHGAGIRVLRAERGGRAE